jgi:hypothetical protein
MIVRLLRSRLARHAAAFDAPVRVELRHPSSNGTSQTLLPLSAMLLNLLIKSSTDR